MGCLYIKMHKYNNIHLKKSYVNRLKISVQRTLTLLISGLIFLLSTIFGQFLYFLPIFHH